MVDGFSRVLIEAVLFLRHQWRRRHGQARASHKETEQAVAGIGGNAGEVAGHAVGP
jgi:hypothetical protein